MVMDPLTASIFVQLYVRERIADMSLSAILGQRLLSRNQALTLAMSSSLT